MLRGEGVICGTTTTGTGTLTLAAVPEPPGGLDFYAWLTTAGMGFVNGNAILAPVVIIEYTDSTFAEEKQKEACIATITIGASLTATTLARTTIQFTATSLNSSPAVPLYGGAASAINVGTAANTLVMIAPSAKDLMMFPPYFETTLTMTTNMGMAAMGIANAFGALSLAALGTGIDAYFPVILARPVLAKRLSFEVSTVYSGGTPVSTAYARIYAVGTNNRPSKLLCDYGALGGANPLNSLGVIQSALHSTGIFLSPGEYIVDLFTTFTGGSAGPSVRAFNSSISSGAFGTSASAMTLNGLSTATGGSSTASDPANVTGYTRTAANPAAVFFSPT